MTILMPDGFRIPEIIYFGSEIQSNARVLRRADASGYSFECSRCGKYYGPYDGHVVGFVSAAAKRHAANCGLPPKLSAVQWHTLRGFAQSVIYARAESFRFAEWHRRPLGVNAPDFPRAVTLRWLEKYRLVEADPYKEGSTVRIQITTFGRENLGEKKEADRVRDKPGPRSDDATGGEAE